MTGTGYVGAVSDDVTLEPGQRWIGEDDVPDIEIVQEAGTGAWVIQTTYIWTEDYIRETTGCQASATTDVSRPPPRRRSSGSALTSAPTPTTGVV